MPSASPRVAMTSSLVAKRRRTTAMPAQVGAPSEDVECDDPYRRQVQGRNEDAGGDQANSEIVCTGVDRRKEPCQQG